MMSFAYDCFLPEGQTWRDLFDMVSSSCFGKRLIWQAADVCMVAGADCRPVGAACLGSQCELLH